MKYNANRALQLLQMGSGNQYAAFREDQEAVIRALVQQALRVLLVKKTGWGKSFVYFIATQLMREQGAGPTWVTAIPSLRHPDLVPDFARRLALALGLPFHSAIKKVVHWRNKKHGKQRPASLKPG